MNWMLVAYAYIFCMYVIPFPVASLYAYIKGANKFLIITPVAMFTIQLIGVGCAFTMGEMEGGLYYLACCFVAMIIGTVGLYYGALRRVRYYGSEMGMNVLRCFAICFCLLVFPIVPAYYFYRAAKSLPKPAEKIKEKPPELGKRPSWQDVVEERKEKKEGGE